MIAAGNLSERITFQKRAKPVDDGYGNAEGDWEDQFTCAAELVADIGRESVEAGSLVGTQAWKITVRDWGATAEVTPAWRAVNSRRQSQIFNIRSNAELVKSPGFRLMLADEGVAT